MFFGCVRVNFTVVARLPTPQYSTHPYNRPPGAPPYFQVGAVAPLHFFFFFLEWTVGVLIDGWDVSKARPLTSHNANHRSEFHKRCFCKTLCKHISRILTCCHIPSINCTPLNLPSNSVVPHTNVFGAR